MFGITSTSRFCWLERSDPLSRVLGNPGALPRWRGRSEQGGQVTHFSLRCPHSITDGAKPGPLASTTLPRLGFPVWTDARQSAVPGRAFGNGISLFTTASPARQRSTASLAQITSKKLRSASAGKAACGSVWYQKAVDAISSWSGK